MFFSDKYHGVILLPEGLIESIPEVYALLKVNLTQIQNIWISSLLEYSYMSIKTIWFCWSFGKQEFILSLLDKQLDSALIL